MFKTTNYIPYGIEIEKSMQSLILEDCQHTSVHEIGEDFDKEGRLLRLVRCAKCGLLMREYLPRL